MGGDVEDGMSDQEQPAVDRAKVQAKVVSRRGAVQVTVLARQVCSSSPASGPPLPAPPPSDMLISGEEGTDV